ncbi:CD209 antigen-like protein D [Penaeus vannamei]|uniref:CD209 antigen-like protein D n=1 Tax=Penaeus vannamei TaxID=6689 RepID=UPI00387FA8A0
MLEDLGCLYTVTTQRNWIASRDNCLSYGAHLFVPQTSEQYFALKDHYTSKGLLNWKWVGLTARKWLDGRLAEDVWNGGEPNGPADTSQCGLMQPEWSMDDKYCVESYEYICQVDL